MSTPEKLSSPIHRQSSQNRLLIKHGKIVNAHATLDADVYIEDGIIKEIGKNLIIPSGTRTLDVKGMYVMPGGIDPHTHLEFDNVSKGMKMVDDFYHGTRAAIAGGTTMIMDFVLPENGNSLVKAYKKRRELVDDKVCCDYSLHVCITWWSDEVKQDVEILTKEGINSFKMFMAYKDHYMLSDSDLFSAIDFCKELGAVPMIHAENGSIIKQAKSPIYIDGLTSKKAADVLATYHEVNKVIGAVMASSLGIDIVSSSPEAVTDPPIRPHSSLDLIQLLSDGYLQVTGSDDCTYTSERQSNNKNNFSEIPSGVNVIEDRMSVIWEKGVESGAMDPQQFVAITSANAAKIFNIFPRKGCIAVGSDADIVIWNHRKTRTISAKTHHQATDTNIFEGMLVHGVPEYVIVSGRVCLDAGEVRPVEGFGKFIQTPTFSPFFYGTEKVNEKDKDAEGSEKSYSRPAAGDFRVHLDQFPYSNPRTAGKGQRHEGQRNQQDSTFSLG